MQQKAIIPKKLHYCWFGKSKMPNSVRKCIASWKKQLPDFELIEWNEDNFDVSSNQYVHEAYQSGKYAFVTDYVRLYAIFHHGGVYMDTDVEVLKSLDKFLVHRAFTGCEDEFHCVTGLLAAEKGHPWIEALLSDYTQRKFIQEDGSYNLTSNTKTITAITTRRYDWKQKNECQELKDGLSIYSSDYFCAKDHRTGKIYSNSNTYTIHHFSGSWKSRNKKLRERIAFMIGDRWTLLFVKLKRNLRNLLKK